MLGWTEGDELGAKDGERLGFVDGDLDGTNEGNDEGSLDGAILGWADAGDLVGIKEGTDVGSLDGVMLGWTDGDTFFCFFFFDLGLFFSGVFGFFLLGFFPLLPFLTFFFFVGGDLVFVVGLLLTGPFFFLIGLFSFAGLFCFFFAGLFCFFFAFATPKERLKGGDVDTLVIWSNAWTLRAPPLGLVVVSGEGTSLPA